MQEQDLHLLLYPAPAPVLVPCSKSSAAPLPLHPTLKLIFHIFPERFFAKS